jgi:hypothetical protein
MVDVRACAAPDCQNVLTEGRTDKKYCSDNCRKRHRRSGQQAAESKNSPSDAFRHLQGDAVLSDWKPHATLETDIPDIPDSLRLGQKQRQGGWDHFDRWHRTHPDQPVSAYRRDTDS